MSSFTSVFVCLALRMTAPSPSYLPMENLSSCRTDWTPMWVLWTLPLHICPDRCGKVLSTLWSNLYILLSCIGLSCPLGGDVVVGHINWPAVCCIWLRLVHLKKWIVVITYLFLLCVLGEALNLDWICYWETLPQPNWVHDQGLVTLWVLVCVIMSSLYVLTVTYCSHYC